MRLSQSLYFGAGLGTDEEQKDTYMKYEERVPQSATTSSAKSSRGVTGSVRQQPGAVQRAVLGGGCFWCLEAAYQLIDGVMSVVPGYAGGHTKNPSYHEVQSQTTGHAEVVRVEFDPRVLSFDDILDIFWAIHNPTTPDRQGNDIGPEYRSIILYADQKQKAIAVQSKVRVQKLWDDPIVTEIKPLDVFYEAEAEHHNYFQNHPEQAYCQVVINPKLAKLRQKFDSKIKR